jgi:glycosyltransferase involved in cell wall biosynthesis
MYNEESEVENAIRKLKDCIDRRSGPVEVLLINDGSKDRTVNVALKAINGDNRFRILSHKVNFGRGRALRTGFTEAKGDIIVTTEGDLSWGEDTIWRMVDALESNPGLDAVFASPHLRGGGYKNVPWHRIFLSKIGNRVLRYFYLGNLSMTTGMTRAYRAKVIQANIFVQDGKEIHLEIAHRLLSLGRKISEVPAVLSWPDNIPGKIGRSKRSDWRKIFKLISSHLSFGIFKGISKIIVPTIFLLTILIIFFGTWAVWNLLYHGPSIYLTILTGVLLTLWVNIIMGYFLLYHILHVEIEAWQTQSLFCSYIYDQGYSTDILKYYDEIDITSSPDNPVMLRCD